MLLSKTVRTTRRETPGVPSKLKWEGLADPPRNARYWRAEFESARVWLLERRYQNENLNPTDTWRGLSVPTNASGTFCSCDALVGTKPLKL